MLCNPTILSILLRRSSDSRPIVWCIIGVFAGIYIFIRGFMLLQKRHLILNTPASKIRSASLGVVEINGLAAGPYTLVAPITERACYHYRTEVYEWKRRGKNNQWVKVAAECMHVPFFIDDNTGKVMVDPRGAELDLHRDFQQEFCDGFFTLKQEAPSNVHSFLLRHGVNTTNKIKVEEFCIKPKNSLFVLGTLDENPGLELTPQPIRDAESASDSGGRFSFSLSSSLSFNRAGERSGNKRSGSDGPEDERLAQPVLGTPAPSFTTSSKVINLSPASSPARASDMSQQQKIAAALVKAGISNPAAWAAAGAGASPAAGNPVANFTAQADSPQASLQKTANAPAALDGFEQRPRVVLMKGKNNPTFLISWRSQRELATSLGWKCTLMIWGGPALTVLCLYALHTMTHWF